MRGVGIIWSNLPTSATDLMADSDKLSRPRVPDVVVQAPQAEIGGDGERHGARDGLDDLRHDSG
jgi:hypothetical protein